MTFAAHATKDDLLGTVTTDGYLSSASAAVVELWGDAEINRLLDRASEAVDDLCGRANFAVDAVTGLASDENIAAGLRMATCALIEQWLEVGEENDVDGLAGTQLTVSGYSGLRAPLAGPRVLRPLKRCGLLTQPEEMSAADWGTL